MRMRCWPYSTCSPFLTRISSTCPSDSALDLVHQLHRLDDADHLAFAHGLAHFDEGGRLGRRRPVEGADEGRADEGPGLAALASTGGVSAMGRELAGGADDRRSDRADRADRPTARRTRRCPSPSTSISSRSNSVAIRASALTDAKSTPSPSPLSPARLPDHLERRAPPSSLWSLFWP